MKEKQTTGRPLWMRILALVLCVLLCGSALVVVLEVLLH